jgi:CheY-like chemotaxis protein
MGAKILALLELDENARQVVKSLTLAGFDVIACQTFTDAIEVLKREPKIEMIISDVHLQNGGTVFDFLRWLKTNGTSSSSSTSLVLFSFRPTELAKYLEDGIRISARLLGVKKYITMQTFDAELFCKEIELVFSEQHGFVDQQLAEEIRLRLALPEKQLSR